MRILRSIYFWFVIGTIGFIGGMYWASSIHRWHQESNDAIDNCRDTGAYETCSSEPISPFASGFLTAMVVGGFWYAVAVNHEAGEKEQTPKSDASSDNGIRR